MKQVLKLGVILAALVAILAGCGQQLVPVEETGSLTLFIPQKNPHTIGAAVESDLAQTKAWVYTTGMYVYIENTEDSGINYTAEVEPNTPYTFTGIPAGNYDIYTDVYNDNSYDYSWVATGYANDDVSAGSTTSVTVYNIPTYPISMTDEYWFGYGYLFEYANGERWFEYTVPTGDTLLDASLDLYYLGGSDQPQLWAFGPDGVFIGGIYCDPGYMWNTLTLDVVPGETYYLCVWSPVDISSSNTDGYGYDFMCDSYALTGSLEVDVE